MLRGGSALHTDSQLRKREDATEHEDDPSAHVSTRANGYLERTGVAKHIQAYFLDLYSNTMLPDNPYPDLVRRFRLAEAAEELFHSLREDTRESKRIRNEVAIPLELTGVTTVKNQSSVWGMPHILEVVDSEHLEKLRWVITACEESMHAPTQGRQSSNHAVVTWVGLTGSAVLAGTFSTSSWGEVQLTIDVEVVTRTLEMAAGLFAKVILEDARGCQGSNRVLLRRVVIDCPARNQQAANGRFDVWTPQELHQHPDLFISRVSTSLSLRPSISMEYMFLPPTGTTRTTLAPPVVALKRFYSMHHRRAVKDIVSFASKPCRQLTAGLFFGQGQAAGVADLLRASGKSFAKKGIVSGMQALALDVEKAREIGDTMAVHTALLPLALASGVNGDSTMAVRAAVDVARVTNSAAARHRSLRQLCDSVREIIGQLIDWVCSTETIMKWESDDEDDDIDNNVNIINEDGSRPENSQARLRDDRSKSAMDLFNNWLAAVHRVFWSWRRDVFMYLDVDDHSDVMIVKDRVRAWIAEISRAETMGLRLPMLRWHRNQRLIADGREEFLKFGRATEKRLCSLSGWLQCLELSLAWDAAKICDRVHNLHLDGINTRDATRTTGPASGLKRPERKSNLPPSLGQKGAFTVPTATTLLQLQRACLLTIKSSDTDTSGTEADANSSKRRKEKPRKAPDTGTVASGKGGTPHRLAPVAPDSTAAAEALDVRLAILETVREGLVPEALVHETTLLRYATENRIDESLHTAVASLITSTFKPNPFPALTSALAPISLKQLLWRQVDSEVAIRPVSSKPWERKQGRMVEVGRHVPVFVAVGEHETSGVFGSSTALAGIKADEMLSLFSMLPQMQQWVRNIVRSWGDEDGGFSSVDIGIDGSGQLPGPSAHHRVASEIAVMIMCTFDYDEETSNTPEENFARLAVHFTMEAHKSSPLVVLDLGFRSATDGTVENEEVYDVCFSPNEILDERQQIETELARAAPDEIIVRTLVKRPISGDGNRSIWTPLSLYFVIFVEEEGGNGCDKSAAAKLLYDSVFPTGAAAENVTMQLSALVRWGLRRHHIENLRFLATRQAGKMDFLGAYRSLRRLRHMRHPKSGDKGYDEPKLQTSLVLGPDEADSEHTPQGPEDHGSNSDVVVDAAIVRMLRGPAGRLQHARRTLDVLETVLSPNKLPPEALVQLREAKTVRNHAEYAVRYLLDTFAELPSVRFEGAVESIKRRARLLLDRVMDVTGGETVEKYEGRLHEACRLAHDVSSLLEIVQIAIQTDFHRCCPEMETILNDFLVEKSNKHRRQTQGVSGRRDFTPNSAMTRRTSLRASLTTGDVGEGRRNK